MKSLKVLATAVSLLGLFALGYFWGTKHQPMADHAASPPTAGESKPPADSMAGHDMAAGEVSVSPEKQQMVGVRTALAEVRQLTKKIRTVGVVGYDETKVAQVFSKVDGWIEQLFVNYMGKAVEKKQPLFTLYSPDLVATQEEYLLALQAEEALAASSLREIRAGASSLVASARRRLSLWDISEEQIDELKRTRQPKRTLTIYSPIAGYVIKKDSFQGMKVMPDKELYTIADLSTVWVNADIYEYELPYIRIGQPAHISLSYFPGRSFTGRVAWIAPVLDDKTRTTKVRIEFANKDLALKPEMYANVEIAADIGKKLAVPDEAVLDSGVRKVVFLDKGDGRFAPAEVKLGGKFDNYYEIVAGLSPGEKILASASFLLDSESRLHEAMGAMAGMEMGNSKSAAADLSTEKKAGDLTLVLETEPAKARLGENVIRVKIRDAKGGAVPDASVTITSTMAMPGMAVGKAAAKHVKDGIYQAPANLAMAGAWEIGVAVERPGQKPVRATFVVKAQ